METAGVPAALHERLGEEGTFGLVTEHPTQHVALSTAPSTQHRAHST